MFGIKNSSQNLVVEDPGIRKKLTKDFNQKKIFHFDIFKNLDKLLCMSLCRHLTCIGLTLG